MPHKFDPGNRDLLLAPERREHLDPERIISLIPIRPYHRVADIGCGPGFFTVPLAKYVNQGKLYALDTRDEMLEACRQRLSLVHLNNVDLIRCGENDLPLPKGSLDGAFVAFVLHEAADRRGFLTAVQEALEQGGWLALLEWYKREMEDGPPLQDRVSEDEARELGQEAGLRYVSLRDLNGKNYMMLFRK